MASSTNSTFTIGLTGGIGSGKSAAAEQFKLLGVTVINADDVAREVVEPGEPALNEIAHKFGHDYLTHSGELDRNKLRQLIFSHPEHKTWLEQLLHPIIGQRIQQHLKAAHWQSTEEKNHPGYVILESPLLLETRQHQWVNRVVAVDVPVEMQITRAMQRDNSDRTTIQKIINSQMCREERLAKADDIIDNSGSLDALNQQVNQLHQQFLTMASSFS